MRWLAGRGFNGYLVDWGRPGPAEQFRSHRLYCRSSRACFSRDRNRTERPTMLIGYCMGGDLALAHALRHQSTVSGLALLATPWDFHAADAIGARAISAMADAFDRSSTCWANCQRTFSNCYFAHSIRCSASGSSKPSRRWIKHPIAPSTSWRSKTWLNDGVPLTARVAQECLGDWYGNNTPAGGGWKIEGQAVMPSALSIPSIAVIPAHDRIVPPESAMSLARLARLPNNLAASRPYRHDDRTKRRGGSVAPARGVARGAMLTNDFMTI